MAGFLEDLQSMGWSTDNILTIINIGVLLLTLYFTNRSSDKKIKADLVSKARIDWIQNVRKSASEFISSCFMFDKMHQWSVEKIGTLGISSNDELREINKHANILILYFGPESEETKKKKNIIHNEKIVNKVIEIRNSINENGWHEKLTENLDDLTELLRVYLKDEWDTAKKN